MTSTLRAWPSLAGRPSQAYALALAQFDRAAAALGLSPAAIRLLRAPARESSFTIPIRSAAGDVRLVPALRVQHTDACGPALADVRLGPPSASALARAHALWLTWTAAVADLPASGAGGWIGVPEEGLDAAQEEQACRGWVRHSGEMFRAELDAVDAGPDAWQHTAWLRDEHRAASGAGAGPRAAAGASPALRHTEAAARAIVGALQMVRAGQVEPSDIGLTVSVQGSRPLAGLVSRRLAATGVIVRAASWADDLDDQCTVERPFGVTIAELVGVSDARGALDRRRAARLGYAVLAADSWLTQPVDAVILTSNERRLRPADVERLHARVRFVVEGTYGLLDPAVDERLAARGITVVPDLLTTVGRLVAHEAPAHVQAVGAAPHDDLERLTDEAVEAAAAAVLPQARGGQCSLRQAAYAVALQRVLDSSRMGGWL